MKITIPIKGLRWDKVKQLIGEIVCSYNQTDYNIEIRVEEDKYIKIISNNLSSEDLFELSDVCEEYEVKCRIKKDESDMELSDKESKYGRKDRS